MQKHSHIALCDREWFFYYEAISFEIVDSIDKYLNLVFDIFDVENIPRGAVESVMYKRIDENSPNPVYFLYGEMVYAWFLCNSCRMISLN